LCCLAGAEAEPHLGRKGFKIAVELRECRREVSMLRAVLLQ
jgi:hypothetical protein